MKLRALSALIPFLIVLASSGSARADVRLVNLFTDHMVVQRNEPVHVWGFADAGEQGRVEFRGNQASFVADKLGRWSVYLPAGSAGGPFTLTVQSSNRVELNDVLVGDLWLASGQSNMQFAMKDRLANGAKEIAAANYPDIRLLTVKQTFADHPLEDAEVSGWAACTPATARDFSAVAYFFGRELSQTEKVPIGIIHSSWGGTPAEAWTSLDALSHDPALMPVFAARAQMMDKLDTIERQQKATQQTNKDLAAQGKKPLDVPWLPNPDTWAPAALFNAMIAPLTPLPIRGVIWYQGESNTDPLRAPMYERVFRAMITDWRARWGQQEMPFLYVQLANFTNSDDWPAVREAQRKTTVLRGTGMAVAIDIGESKNIHPADKQDVGHRLALLARNQVYGEDIEDSGPLFRAAAPEGNEIVVSFTHAAKLTAKGAALTGFEVAGEDGRFFAATARIERGTVRVGSSMVPHPLVVRYGWSNDPHCNLYNQAGLPASPFTSQ